MSIACHICGSTDTRIVHRGMRDWEYGVPGEYAFAACADCGMAQLEPFPTLDDLIKAYPPTYPAYITDTKQAKGWLYDFLVGLHFKMMRKALAAKVPPGARALDVGAGNGDFLLKLKKMGAGDLVGIDFNPKACDVMQAKGISTFCGVFMDYEPNGLFDIISMNNYIEHVLDPAAELAKACALLKPGGWLIGTLPNFAGIDRLLFGKYWGGNHAPRHTFQFSPPPLEHMLKQAGFVEVAVTQDINSSHLAISLQNFAQRHVKDLAHNPALKSGRVWYYNYMMLLVLPVNILFTLAGRSGVMNFSARKPTP